MAHKTKRIVITPGEPAGIGPDLAVMLAQHAWPCAITVVADPDLLAARAQLLNLPFKIIEFTGTHLPHQIGTLCVWPEKLAQRTICGELNPANAHYVLNTLKKATKACLDKQFDALVTGPVHKGIINEAGIAFTGHTEFLADFCKAKQVVMVLATDELRVALLTTHLPLRDVVNAITAEKINTLIPVLVKGLQDHFNIRHPHIFVAGLNPHAGEGGHLGHEEIEIISPALKALRAQGYQLTGPLSADTMFSPQNVQQADAFLCMYHDQGLPLLKYAGFGKAANITLGLPFLRTSVDHGTALTLAGTYQADPASFFYALKQPLRFN